MCEQEYKKADTKLWVQRELERCELLQSISSKTNVKTYYEGRIDSLLLILAECFGDFSE